MNTHRDDSALLSALATAAPIFALLVLLRLTASPVLPPAAAPTTLVVTVHEGGWALHVGPPPSPGLLGSRSTWVPRLSDAGGEGTLLRRAARDLLPGGAHGGLRVEPGPGADATSLRWTRSAFSGLQPTVPPHALASAQPVRLGALRAGSTR